MGFKRPFDDEEFEELPFKHSRQLDRSNKLIHFSDCYDAFQNTKISGENEVIEDKNTEVSKQAEKDLETSAPLSWVTSSSGDEDAGTGGASYSSLSPEYFEFNFPQRTFTPFEDVYSSYLDRPPKRQVPLGPNHQATLPVWSGHLQNNVEDSDYEHDVHLMGSCVIQMPDMKLPHNNDKAGSGRTNCGCIDEGSVRCVRQHLTEEREVLKKALGHEKFVTLGFYDMGEEVAHRWTEEEQRVFHEVVYSNPASLGQNFWKHLPAVFPYRTTKELVSYYFNVFILHRRAVQNRSNLLNVDSDNDEWHGNRTSREVRVSEDDDSDIDSLVDQDDQDEIGRKSHENDDDSDDDDSDNDDCDCGGGGGGDEGDKCGDAMGEDCGIVNVSDGLHVKSFGESRFDTVTSKVGGSDGVDGGFNVKHDSHISLQHGHSMVDSWCPFDAETSLPMSSVRTDHNKSLHGQLNGSRDVTRHVYLMEPCDAKVWDARYPSPTKGVDFLPTCNIIEEIFGKESWDDKTTNGGPTF
ncbi:hypothetical protein HS088_TW07G01018 [Tripterygium wilfordii]|uniref:Myb-like domain-containing protein n=1 Tax=Tripterygium wilfordii TaxID=458696 RepID=A0A7J7DGP6_TRIWF|nr:uncharacterized protein LOC120002565 [Tripterygium wilfordii]XP_038707258.1 uncharacterized protein LOC120002565 [Tripterygium wilfordii]KAF5745434.1 hypothetical protein HS088_TW07G01018 [Tripterygium wilfordii]